MNSYINLGDNMIDFFDKIFNKDFINKMNDVFKFDAYEHSEEWKDGKCIKKTEKEWKNGELVKDKCLTTDNKDCDCNKVCDKTCCKENDKCNKECGGCNKQQELKELETKYTQKLEMIDKEVNKLINVIRELKDKNSKLVEDNKKLQSEMEHMLKKFDKMKTLFQD